MAIQNRTVTIKNIFAENANTTIPNPPVPGESYRNTSTTAAEIGEGWPFKEIVDSAKFNESMYEYTTICKQLEEYGFLPWCADTDYPAGGCALGTDGNVYQAKVDTGPSTTSFDPVNDTSHTYWDLFYYPSFTASRAIASDANGKLTPSLTTATELGYVHGVTSAIQTQINQKANASDVVNLTGSQTISGQKTFTDKVEIQGANGYILFHIPGTMYTRLQESANGLEVRSGDGANLATLFAGWSDANNSVVVTAAKSKSSNGGFKLSNGMIVNWGTVSGSGGTVSYSIPFSGTNYGISMTRISANGTNDNDAITAVTSTNFSATIYQGGGAHWIAIGY